MQRMALTPGETAAEVYVIFRVYNLKKDSMGLRIFVDPEKDRLRNRLLFESQAWTVAQRG